MREARAPARRGRRPGLFALAWLVGVSAPGAASPADDATFVASRRVHPDGLTLLQPQRRRTPTGFLYPYPFAPPETQPAGGAWTFRGYWELGALESWGGSDEAYLEEYDDLRDGVTGGFRVETQHPPSGAFVEVGATDPGRDDGSAFLEGGIPGRLRVSGFYDEIPHRFANDARPIHEGVGSGDLVLRPPLVPSGSSDAAVDATLADARETRLRLSRESAGVALRVEPAAGLALRAGYRLEEREGERPFGGAIRFAFQNPNLGSIVETVEPRDARTHDFHGGLAYTGRWLALDLEYQGQVFDNEERALTWENPFSLPGASVDRGRAALAPDNTLHQLGGTMSWMLPARARWTHTFSWATARQDERLLAPTVNPAFPDWSDPLSSLGRDTADARVDTTVATSSLQLTPLRRLSLGATGRYRERDNRTRYFAFNPAVDDYGYVVEDGSFGIRPRFGAAPFDEEAWSVEGKATWRVVARTRLSLEVEHERVERDQRARRETRDTRGRVSLSTRRLPHTTVRLAYELSQRRGSRFDHTRDAVFYSAGPPDFALPPLGTPQRSLLGFEQVDLADRVAQRGALRVSFLLGDFGDLAFAMGARDSDYDADFGVRSARSADAHVELAVMPSPAFDAHAFAGAEWRRRRLLTIAGMGPGSTQLEPGGPAFPADNEWTARSTTRVLSAGGGLSARPFDRLELRGDYFFLISRERVDYDFAGTGALAPGVTAAAAGSRFPHLRNADHILDASAEIGIVEQVSLHLLYRYHRARVRDFQQTDLVPRIGHAIYLGHVDGDFIAHVLGAGLKVRF